MHYWSVAILSIFIVGGCSTRTDVVPYTPDAITPLPGYIWSYGCPMPSLFSPCSELGLLQKIKGSDIEIQINDSLRKKSGTSLPAGQYVATIAHFENYTCTSGVAYELLTGVGASCNRITDTHELSFTVKDNHLYIPFAKKECDTTWVWIEDWGYATDNVTKYLGLYNVHPRTGNPFLGPAVKRRGPRRADHDGQVRMTREATTIAGETPPDVCPRT